MKRAEDDMKVILPPFKKTIPRADLGTRLLEGMRTTCVQGDKGRRRRPENTLPSPCRDDLSLRGQGRKHAPFFSCWLFVEQGGRALYFQGLATRGVSLFVALQFVALVTFSLVDCAPNSLGLSHMSF